MKDSQRAKHAAMDSSQQEFRKETLALVGGSGMSGGVEAFNSRLAEHLNNNNFSISSLPLNSYLRRGNPLLLGWVWLWSILVAAVQIAWNRHDYVVVSCANFLDIIAARLIATVARRSDVMVVAHFNASWSFWQNKRYVSFIRSSSRVFRLFSIAPSQKRFFADKNLIVEDEIFPNFFNYSARSAKNDLVNRDNSTIALYVGRIVEEKEVDKVAEYLLRVADPTMPVVFRLVGPGPEQFKEKLSALANDVFTIEFFGMLDAEGVSAAMNAADCFISFSGSDTLPLTYLEAAAHGLPVVTIDNLVTRDVQDLMKDIIFVDPNEDAKQSRSTLGKIRDGGNRGDINKLIQYNNEFVLKIIRGTQESTHSLK